MSELQHNSKTKVDAVIDRQFFAQANVSSNPSSLKPKRSLNKKYKLKNFRDFIARLCKNVDVQSWAVNIKGKHYPTEKTY